MTWYVISLIIVVAISVHYYLNYYAPQKSNGWRQIPFLAEYLLKYPDCEIENKQSARCYHCESDKVISQPLTKHANSRCKHVCLNCNYVLFRS